MPLCSMSRQTLYDDGTFHHTTISLTIFMQLGQAAAITQSCIFAYYGRSQDIQQNIEGTTIHSQLFSEILFGNSSVIVVDLEPRLVWSWKFPEIRVASTCLASLSSTVFNHYKGNLISTSTSTSTSFLYSHLFSYNTTIKNKKEVKRTELIIH